MAPFVMFREKGYRITVASIKGGKIPIDPTSLQESNLTDKVRLFEQKGALLLMLLCVFMVLATPNCFGSHQVLHFKSCIQD
jgi:hypothetical protein